MVVQGSTVVFFGSFSLDLETFFKGFLPLEPYLVLISYLDPALALL
jgi:hypothetical protein